MITITVLKNPFNHSDREIHACEHVPGKTAYEYVQPYIIGLDDFVVSICGNVVENAKEQMVNYDDWIAVCPVVGKSGADWFRTIGMLALGAAASGWARAWGGKFWANMAAGAVGAIGGALLNHWFPAAQVDRKTYEISPSYTWSNAQSPTDQGNALAVTYGAMRTAGQVLAQHVSSDGDNQYLNILLCGGEGPLDSISDIRINDNPISYYKDIIVETRLGSNDQPVIANFNDAYADQALAYELNTDNTWTTQQTEGNAVEGLEIMLEFPYGLYYVNDNGSLGNASVTLQAQYHKVGDANWSNFTDGTDNNLKISAAKNTAFFRTYRIDNLPAAQYEVRVQCTGKSGTDNRYSTRVYWTQLSSIMYDDFSRPGKVLVGIKALATNQLSGGAPSITWVQARSHVWVWNAASGQYEQKPAANPAWAAYDMIHRCRQIKNIHTGSYEFIVQGAPASQAVYQDFVNWAAFCDERRLTFDYIFNTAADLWTTLQKPEGVGRGKVIMRGTKFGCVCDAPGHPVQLFTVGNMITDKFKETFVGLKDRANAIEITFSNKDKAYQKEVITAYADDYDGTTEPNITQITLDGATTVDQAYREGKYRLRLNQYLQRTVEHSADIDAIACQINDVVLLAHDVPQWGYSGRLLAATATTLQLDRQVTLEPGKSYAVAIQITNPAATTAQDAQSIVTVGVQGVVEETCTDMVTLTSVLTRVPLNWDLYSFGETNKVVKPFRVLSISRDQDLRRKISCIEYIEEVYTEAADIPEVNYSELEATAEVSSVSVAEETYRQKDGTMVSNLNVAWSIPRGKMVSGYKVLYSCDDGQTWSEWGAGITALSTAIIGVKTQTAYLVKVCTISYAGVVSAGVSCSVYVTGKDAPPSDVPSLAATIDTTDSTKVILTWPGVNDVDLRGYQVREGSTVLTLTPISDTRYVYTAAKSRQHNFSVVAIDNSGNPSQIPATTAISVAIEPAQVAGFSVVPKDTDRSRLVMSWTANTEKDLSYYEIRNGDDWDAAQPIATQLKATVMEYQVTAEGNYNFLIRAFNVAGHGSVQPASQYLHIILRPDAPTNLVAVQEPRDRSMVKITWDPPPGYDIAGYELRYGDSGWDSGTPINTVTDCQYWWYPPTSGAYTIMVRAKTVAGWYSNVVNVFISVIVEPYDVTGFTASQSISDRTKVTLAWDTPLSLDVSYFVIKKGISWDSGVVVGNRVTGTFCDVIVTEETEQTFWIKAVSVAGHESLYPASIMGIFSLKPSPVTDIQLSQDPNDRSILNISYSATPESDLANYEIRCGYVWDTAEVIGETKELRWTYSPPVTGDVKIMIKAKNAAEYYSDEASAHLYVTLEPGNVTGFRVFQNGEKLAFVWNKVPDNDVVGYELREGSNFDNGVAVAAGITLNEYSLAVDMEILRRFHIKAINRSGHYSLAAASVDVTVKDLPPRNVIATFDEIALQSGAHSGTEFGASLITFAALPGKFSDYPSTKFSDIGGLTVLKLAQSGGVYPESGEYDCERIDLGQVITANITAVFQPSILYTAGTSASLEYRTSRDGTTWTDWQPFYPLEATFRYADFRVLLATTDTSKTPEVNQLSIRIDVPDTDIAKTVTVPVGGMVAEYGHVYYTLPVVTATADGVKRRTNRSEKTVSNVFLQVFDTETGADVGGDVDLIIRGY